MAIRITQAGVALTVGIIIVTGLIIGGFFLVKNSGEQARRNEAIKIAEQNLEEQSDKDIAISKNSGENRVPKDETGNEEVIPTDNAKAQTEASNNTQAQEASELPRTGAADQLSGLVVVSVLAFSVASYVTSRRQA